MVVPKRAGIIGEREGCERALDQSCLLDTLAGLPRLCGLVVLLSALATGCGDAPKDRDRCTERASRKLMAEVKEKYPPDKWQITCDPKTGFVYHTQKPLDGGVDGGKGGE
jgi:hypothetical protein